MTKTNQTRTAAVLAVLAIPAFQSAADIFSITWLDQSPTALNSPVPNNSNFFLPGAGNVNVTYSIPSTFIHGRQQNGSLMAGNVTLGPDTWAWTNHEQFAATLLSGPDPLVPVAWDITYTFTGTLPAGSLVVGVAGLGRTDSFGGGASVATVNQNGTFLGDWDGSNNWGPTQFTGGVGTFSMQNSLSGLGGADPHWNTPLGVVRIDDAVSSITVRFAHIRGDGVGVNIGFVPSPAAASMLGLAGLAATRRRR